MKPHEVKHGVRGYTLVEILVVLLIISIVTGAGLLSISRNQNKQLETFASEMTQLITLAQEQAMLQPSILGLVVMDHSFHFSSYEVNEFNNKAGWVLLDDTILGQHAIPSMMQVEVRSQNKSSSDEDKEKRKETPQVIISTNGALTPFAIYVAKKGEKPRFVITGESNGHVSYKLVS